MTRPKPHGLKRKRTRREEDVIEARRGNAAWTQETLETALQPPGPCAFPPWTFITSLWTAFLLFVILPSKFLSFSSSCGIISQKQNILGRKRGSGLRALAALADGPASVSSTHKGTTIANTSRNRGSLPSSYFLEPKTHAWWMQTSIHRAKMSKFLKNISQLILIEISSPNEYWSILFCIFIFQFVINKWLL